MKKNASIIVGSLIIIIIAAIFYFISSFQLFDVNKDFLGRKKNLSTGEIIEVYYVDSGATSQNTIQVIRIGTDGKKSIISNIAGYTYLIDFELLPTSRTDLYLKRNANSLEIDTISISW